MKKLTLRIIFASIMFAVAVAPTNAGQKHRHSSTRAPEFGDIGQFKAAFQAGAGKVRLVALVSPT